MSAKKVIKVIFWIIGLILILLLACVIALQSSKVQTWLAGKVTEKLENSIDGKIEFSRIHISPLDGVVIQDLVILDENPYSSENFAPVDTFVRAGSLTAGYSLRRLFSKKDGIGIRNVRLSNAEFNMVTEPDPEDSTKSKLNLTRIFKLGNDDDDDDDEINLPKLKIGKLDVENFRYTLRDAKHPKKGEEGEICWKDLDIRNINLHANRFNMGGTEIGAKVDELSFKEKSGYEVTKASGDVVAGNNVTKIENLKLTTNGLTSAWIVSPWTIPMVSTTSCIRCESTPTLKTVPSISKLWATMPRRFRKWTRSSRWTALIAAMSMTSKSAT